MLTAWQPATQAYFYANAAIRMPFLIFAKGNQ